MKLHFVAVAEVNVAFINMLKLLLFSFRKNAGVYKDAPFTVVVNATQLPEVERRSLQENFHVSIRPMPRLGNNGTFVNKFNAFYAVDEDSYDIMVFLDCDTVIVGSLAGIAEGLTVDKAGFKALPSGAIGISRYRRLIEHYATLPREEIEIHRNDAVFPTRYPLFNDGVLAMTKSTVLAVREDAILICNALSEYRTRSVSGVARYYYNRVLEKTHLPLQCMWGSHYPIWCSDQFGLTLSVLKHRITYECLDPVYNWNGQRIMETNQVPLVLHYMKGLYEIPRERLFEGEWIKRYAQSNVLEERILAQTVTHYCRDTAGRKQS
jgi:hypothetical protein